jgi:hypothetical protein
MATITIEQEQLRIAPTGWERFFGILRDLRVPLSSIRSIEPLREPIDEVRGLKAPGLGLPGRKFGTWRHDGTTIYVVVRRGEPGARILLQGQHYDEVLISVVGADSLAAALRARLT